MALQGANNNGEKFIFFVSDTKCGLEPVCTYPFLHIRRTDILDKEYYKNRIFHRYIIENIRTFYGLKDIKKEILKNFRTGGKKFPLIASFIMGDFATNKTSKKAANPKNLPYRPP